MGPDAVEEIAVLLDERNGTIPGYTRWKYASRGAGEHRGVVARWHGKVVGCFGVVPRTLELSGGPTRSAGWFADWYVRPEARDKRIGAAMLRALSADIGLVFGHPQPAKAQALCRAHGYRQLGFQSQRRMVLRPWTYERARSRYLGKVAARWLHGRLGSVRQRHSSIPGGAMACTARFTNAELYGKWIVAQPVAAGARRRFGTWSGMDLEVTYAEDFAGTGAARRRVLYTRGDGRHVAPAWRPFFDDCLQAGCVYAELFTTERGLDAVWQRWGAWPIAEPPVLVIGLPEECGGVVLHGWDRESWTFLASRAHETPGSAASHALATRSRENDALPV